MKKTILLIATFFAMLQGFAANPKPFVIPEVKEWQGAEGSITISNSSRIVIAKDKVQLRSVAEQLAADWAAMFGQKLPIVVGKAKAQDIQLTLLGAKKMGAEAYTMQATDKVVLSASTQTGLYWSTRTLLQIAEQSEQHAIPCGMLKDEPEYAMRGFMIDCGRKYIPMDYLQNLVKVMAYYKLNTLQVHLNDNGFKQYFQDDWDKTYSGFRLESDTYPGLASEDGHYGKKEFHDFILTSANQCVEIIPEIDAPAHTLAFSQYKKELGSKEYGMDHMDLFNPETYNFLDALFKEYLEGPDPVFCCPRVHIGTDEYSNRDSVVVEKFRYFTDRYIKYVEGFGKQALVWGSLTHAKGKQPVKVKDVLMSMWSNGYAEPEEMKNLGYQMISIPDGYVYIVPAAGYYYDYLNDQFLYDGWTPANVGGKVYAERDKQILGGMFAVWNDHCGNGISVSDIHHRLFPAMQTISAKCWTASKVTVPFDEWNSKRKQLSEAPTVNELGRYLKSAGTIVEKDVLKANETDTEHDFIGYNYRVSFTLDAANEALGTVLLSSSRSTFYLSDPVGGFLGFSRDGYLYTFKYKIHPGTSHTYTIEGDNKATRLFIDGKQVEELNTEPRWYAKDGKGRMFIVKTLVFPLQKSGNFKSKVSNLKVEQL